MQKVLKTLLLLLCVGSAQIAYAQTADHTRIRARFDRFAQFTKALKIDSILAYTYPKLFQLVPRQVIKDQLVQAGQDQDMRVVMGLPRLDSLSRSIYRYEGESYALLYYRSPMTITLLSAEYRNTEFYEKLGQQFAETFGIENLSGDREQFEYTINAPKKAFAIRSAAKGPWYLLEFTPDNAVLLDAILPQAVRKHFGLK